MYMLDWHLDITEPIEKCVYIRPLFFTTLEMSAIQIHGTDTLICDVDWNSLSNILILKGVQSIGCFLYRNKRQLDICHSYIELVVIPAA